jgi:hypothetical protein
MSPDLTMAGLHHAFLGMAACNGRPLATATGIWRLLPGFGWPPLLEQDNTAHSSAEHHAANDYERRKRCIG